MNTTDLVYIVRTVIDDTVEPYLVSDEDIVTYLSEAQKDFAEQTYCLFSATTETTSSTSGNAWVDIPSNVLTLRALVTESGAYIRPVTTIELDYGHFSVGGGAVKQSTWRALTGTPKFAVTDQSSTQVRLVPAPTTGATYTVEAYIRPDDLSIATGSEVDPVIPNEYHEDLVAGAVYRLYGSQNVDLFDPDKSVEWRMKWNDIIMRAINQLDTARRVITRRFVLPKTMDYKPTVLGDTQQAAPKQQQ